MLFTIEKIKLLGIAIISLLFSCLSVHAKNHIVISKAEMKLRVINDLGDTLIVYGICCGHAFGNKEEVGDMKTPEGTFTITEIVNATKWMHDFNDGAGMRKGAYGKYFFRLGVPNFKGIGIHGTCFPESIGTRSSEGCIRLKNEDLERLRKYVFKGMVVIIEADFIEK